MGGGGIIKFKTLHKILRRERCTVEGTDGSLLQNIVCFFNFSLYFQTLGGYFESQR